MSNFDFSFDQQKQSHYKELLSCVLKMWFPQNSTGGWKRTTSFTRRLCLFLL